MALSRSLHLISSLPLSLSPPPPPTSKPTTLSSKTLSLPFRTNTRHRSLNRIQSAAATTTTASRTDLIINAGDDLPEEYGSEFPSRDPTRRRRAGVLLHPSSLPGPDGIGDFGDSAFRFLDWLHSAGFSVWQVLPLVPPGRKSNEDGSPYSGQDANCGNTLLISLEELVKDDLLMADELPEALNVEQVQFAAVAGVKDPLIAKAAKRLISSQGKLKRQLDNFRKDPRISCTWFVGKVDPSLMILGSIEGTYRDWIPTFLSSMTAVWTYTRQGRVLSHLGRMMRTSRRVHEIFVEFISVGGTVFQHCGFDSQ